MGNRATYLSKDPRAFNPEEDSLLKIAKSVQILDTLDSMDRRDQQAAFQQAGLDIREREMQQQAAFQQAGMDIREREMQQQKESLDRQMQMRLKEFDLEKQRVDLGLVAAQRQQDQDSLNLWNKTRAETAMSYSSKAAMEIDVSSPEGEKKLGDWMSYARANGVDDDSIRSIFGTKLNELGVRKEAQINEQAKALGDDGLILFEAIKKTGVDSARAQSLASQSIQAQQTLAAWQKYAKEKGVPLVLDADDYASIKKRVGNAQNVTIADGAFDPRPAYYDLDAVNQIISKRLTPELKAQVEQEAYNTTLYQNDLKAATDTKLANAAQSRASAEKTTTETTILKKDRPDAFQNPQAAQSGGDGDQTNGSPKLPSLGYKLFGPRQTPTPAPTN